MPTILVVCTANQCRSPMAEALLKRHLADAGYGEWHVESAGVWTSREGIPATPKSRQVMRDLFGLDIEAHRSRTVTREMLEAADLVLVMEEGRHKEALCVEFPEFCHKIYLLSEMAGMAYDIVDPIGQPIEAYEATARELDQLIRTGLPRIVEIVQPKEGGSRSMSRSQEMLQTAFKRREATVAVIGLGYVGLPLALAFARAGFEVIGIDVDARKVELLQQGISYIEDIRNEDLRQVQYQSVPVGTPPDEMKRGTFQATTRFDVLADADAVIICVPTPLSKTGDPDISYITAAVEQIAKRLHPGMLITLESTTYPGTTTEVVLPALTVHQPLLEVGRDFFLCFSPERIDPGRRDWTLENTPKVMGGVTPACLEVGRTLYEQAIETIVPVRDTETAEMVKLLENTFRAVNVALVNEVLLMCDRLGLDAWEVIEAAATKPFGFMKFTPGPGLGGHCLPIDPLYLSWKLKTLNYNARFIDLATQINTSMPAYWVQKVQDALNEEGKPVRGSQILIIGVAYKRNVSDLRESPALDIIHLLQAKGAIVKYHDPHVPQIDYDGIHLTSVAELSDALDRADCVVIVTDHSSYDWSDIRRRARLIVDTRHVF